MWQVEMAFESNDRWPFLSKVIILITSIFIFTSTFSIAFSQIALSLLFSLWVAVVVTRKIFVPWRTELDFPVLLFLLACTISVVFSEDRLGSIVHLKNILLLSVIYLMAYIYRENLPLDFFVTTLFISSAGSAAYGIAIFFLGKGEGTLGRTPGPFSNAMTFGGVLLILSTVSVAFLVARRVKKGLRILAGISTFLTLVALFFTFTRSSWIGVFVSLSVVLSILRKKLLFIMVAIVILVFLFSPPRYKSRFISIFDPNYRTNVQRIELLKGGLAIFRDHPLVGVGTMDLAKVYEKYKPPGAKFIHGHMHNDFLQIAVSMGIVGLMSFLYLFFSFFRLAWKNLGKEGEVKAIAVATIGVLSGFLINGLFEWNFGDAEVVTLMYLLIGFNLAIFKKYDSKFVNL